MSLVTWSELTEQQLAEARAKHGEVTRLGFPKAAADDASPQHFVFVRHCHRPEFREFSASANAGRDRAVALENLVKRCLVHPPADEFDKHLNRYPALGVTFGGLLLELAGAGDGEKKTM